MDKIEKSNFEEVQIALRQFHVQNVESLIRLVYSLKASHFLNKYEELCLIDRSVDEQLDGEFYLNRLKAKLNMSIVRTGLLFKAV